MSERTQILTVNQILNPGLVEERQTFTPLAIGNDVALDPYVAPGAWPFTTETGTLRDGESQKWFHKKDGFNILSIGISMPYSFAASTVVPYLGLRWRDSTGLQGVINFGTPNGLAWLPMENFETAIGTYVPWPSAAIGSIYLVALLGHPGVAVPHQFRVSLVNAPGAFVGVPLPITIFLKITQNDKLYPAA